MENSATIPELISGLTKKYRNRLLLQRRDGWSWKQLTWLDFDSEVKNVASFLLGLGFEPGESTLMISSNNNECLVCELAVYSLGGIVIPFSDYNSFSQFSQVVSSAMPGFIFLQNEEILDEIQNHTNLVEDAKKVFILDDSKLGENDKIVPYKAAVKFGQIKKKELADKLQQISAQVRPEQKALTIYSNNEDSFKEINFDHEKIIELISAAYDRLKFISSEDQSYSYLLSSGLFDKLINLVAISLGVRIIIAEDKDCFYEDILEAKPTILFETRSGVEDICNHLNGSNLKNMLGGRVQYLITDEEPSSEFRNRIKKSNICVIAIPQFTKVN